MQISTLAGSTPHKSLDDLHEKLHVHRFAPLVGHKLNS